MLRRFTTKKPESPTPVVAVPPDIAHPAALALQTALLTFCALDASRALSDIAETALGGLLPRIAEDLAELQRLVAEFESTRTVNVVDESDNLSAVAVQGPHVNRFISQLFTMSGLIAVERPTALEKNQIDVFIFEGKDVYVSRTGYTGEDGFELIAPNEIITTLWERLMELGSDHGIKPAGLGARDTLRMEMGYPLYGHELSEGVSPLEAGLGFFVNMEKTQFSLLLNLGPSDG